jgi:DNA-binding Lrp family transcriptional regulator
MTFDETNAKILALLQRDSSLTNEAIGSEVNLSPTAVIKRVKKLPDSGVIEECLGGHGRGGRCPPGPHPHGRGV